MQLDETSVAGHTLLATPVFSENGVLEYSAGIFEIITKLEIPNQSAQISVGRIVYSNGQESDLTIPKGHGVAYNINIASRANVEGLHIDSHRPVQSYQQIVNIPINPVGAAQAYSIYHQETLQRYQNSYTQFSPIYRMKEAIISMATFGPGNKNVQPNASMARLFVDFKKILSKVLPRNIGFKDISIRIPDVVLVTKSGDFVLDAASGGLMSIIDLAWQLFLYSYDKDEFVVTLDEPENHLHPSMQRALLRQLLSAFPKAQFIIATHSPFIVSSVKDSSVYVLDYDNDEQMPQTGKRGKVNSLHLDTANKAGTASEILRNVLGVPVTLPEWAEDELRKIAKDFQIVSLDGRTINRLRKRLEKAGLGEYYPEALRQIAARK